MQPIRQLDPLQDFLRVRRRLLGIACRLLGSAAEAEDIVQDVWLRWQVTDRSAVHDPMAFLATATMRLAINAAQCAHARHEFSVGPCLPEPVDTGSDPHMGVVRGEALEFAAFLLLEKLSSAERAAYVLREAFDYPYRRIAEVLQLAEPNTRQLVARARHHIAAARHAPVTSADQRRLLETFIAAARKGELAALEGLFASAVISHSDGCEAMRAARIPLARREQVGATAQSIHGILWMMNPRKRSALLNRNKSMVA